MTWLTDLILEVRIRRALNRMMSEACRECQRKHAAEMARLIAMRSPGRVAAMERRAGLQ